MILGGSLGRREATGRGVMIVSIAALQKLELNQKLLLLLYKDLEMSVRYLLSYCMNRECKIIGLSDVNGAIYNSKGFNLPEVIDYVEKNKTLTKFPNAEVITNEELLRDGM